MFAALHIDRVDRAPAWPAVVRDPGPVWGPRQGVHRSALAVLGTDAGPERGLTTGRRVDERHLVAEYDDEFVPGGRPVPRSVARGFSELPRSAADGIGDPEGSGLVSDASTERDPRVVG